MNAEEMRKITEQGKVNNQTAAQAEYELKRQKEEQVNKRAREVANTTLKTVIEQITGAAMRGENKTTYHIGEGDDEGFVNALAYYLRNDLADKGYQAKVESDVHEPFGSDPGRFDTYYTYSIAISW